MPGEYSGHRYFKAETSVEKDEKFGATPSRNLVVVSSGNPPQGELWSIHQSWRQPHPMERFSISPEEERKEEHIAEVLP